MPLTSTAVKGSSGSLKIGKATFIVSVIGLSIQGLAGLAMYGPALVAGSNGIPNDVSMWLSENVAPITATDLWVLVLAFTLGTFATGLAGLIWLQSTRRSTVRLGAILLLISAALAATPAPENLGPANLNSLLIRARLL